MSWQISTFNKVNDWAYALFDISTGAKKLARSEGSSSWEWPSSWDDFSSGDWPSSWDDFSSDDWPSSWDMGSVGVKVRKMKMDLNIV